MTFNKANPDLSTDTPDSLTTYTIGDDVIAQKVGSAAPQYLLYDGHGSTRQLAGYASGTGVTLAESYSYDGYGVLLQDKTNFTPNSGPYDPGYTPPQATSLLYSGEMFDADAQQYYLRARYYNPLNGLFNQTDPYTGNMQDPQSLHKYAYCHNNPVNMIDPSGKWSWSITAIVVIVAIVLFRALNHRYYGGLRHPDITDDDVVNAIRRFTSATNILEDIIEPAEKCPMTQDEINRKLHEKGVYQIGQMLVGVVNAGPNDTPGIQRITEYFESILWTLFHPEAREHGTHYTGGNLVYIDNKAEVKRMRIIIRELTEEANRRRIPGY